MGSDGLRSFSDGGGYSLSLLSLRLFCDPRLRRGTYSSPIRSAAIKASYGMLTFPYSRIRAFPFCFSASLFLRVGSSH